MRADFYDKVQISILITKNVLVAFFKFRVDRRSSVRFLRLNQKDQYFQFENDRLGID